MRQKLVGRSTTPIEPGTPSTNVKARCAVLDKMCAPLRAWCWFFGCVALLFFVCFFHLMWADLLVFAVILWWQGCIVAPQKKKEMWGKEKSRIKKIVYCIKGGEHLPLVCTPLSSELKLSTLTSASRLLINSRCRFILKKRWCSLNDQDSCIIL